MNLCCGYSLEKATKVIAASQLISLLVGLGLFVFFSVETSSQYDPVYGTNMSSLSSIRIFVGISALAGFALCYLLYTGATKRSITRINGWLLITWTEFILIIVLIIVKSDSSEGIDQKTLYIILGLIILTSWYLCVVHDFKREVKRDGGPKESRRDTYDDNDRWTDAVFDIFDCVANVK